MNEKLLKLLNGNESLYPRNLEEKYPRVFEKIHQLWNTAELDAYLDELMMDSRGGHRQGFQPEAASEIFRLSMAHARRHEASSTDVWSNIAEKHRIAMEELGFKHTPQGFMQASEAGNTRALQMFLGSGINLETRDERDWTPLMISAFNGKEAAAMLLIQHGARIETKDKNGYSPIHWAAFNGFSNVVGLLIRSGANTNALSNFGWTPLMQAATRGHTIVAAQLIAGGALVNEISQDHWTALHKAAANGHTDLVRLLLSKGANPAIEYQQGGNALSLAFKGNHEEIINMLSAHQPPPPKSLTL